MLWGPSHSGKTSVCLYLSKKALEQGKNVLYWDTEGSVENHNNNTEHVRALIEASEKNGSDFIVSEEVPRPEEFLSFLDEVEQMIVDQDIEVLIIDSIVMPFIDMQSNRRASHFKTVFKKLDRITSAHNLVTVTTTHLSTRTMAQDYDFDFDRTVNTPLGGRSLLHVPDVKYYIEDYGDGNNPGKAGINKTDENGKPKRLRCILNVEDKTEQLAYIVNGEDILEVQN